ncbi:hypothetical protein MMC12_000861 [Toensbergia leucococca]|nr:hypothetical protein [Toensbergia leucococca]
MAPPSILVVGSLNTDLITRTSRLPLPGETLTSISFDIGSGGKGANQAVACARLSRSQADTSHADVDVYMVGAIGDDFFGRELIKGLEEDGVNTDGVSVKHGIKTGVSTIIVEEQTGENRILFSPNANYTIQPSDFITIPSPRPELILLQLELPLPTVLQVLETATEHNIPVLLNPAPAVSLPHEAYRSITHLILNETEAVALARGDSNAPSLDSNDNISLSQGDNMALSNHFRSLGVKTVVITLGAKGVFFSPQAGIFETLPAEKVERVVDTTAAGDTFVGAYAVELAKYLTQMHTVGIENRAEAFDVSRAVKLANRAAAKTVERSGAQAAIPWKDEI